MFWDRISDFLPVIFGSLFLWGIGKLCMWLGKVTPEEEKKKKKKRKRKKNRSSHLIDVPIQPTPEPTVANLKTTLRTPRRRKRYRTSLQQKWIWKEILDPPRAIRPYRMRYPR